MEFGYEGISLKLFYIDMLACRYQELIGYSVDILTKCTGFKCFQTLLY